MPALQNLREDLAYVRRVATRAEPPPARGVFILWAAVILISATLADFRPGWLVPFMIVAIPLGSVVGFGMVRRARLRQEQVSRAADRREIGHWAVLLAAWLLALLLAASGRIAGDALGSLGLLIAAVGYLYAGLHLDRRLLRVGLIMAAGYVLSLWLPAYRWTATGAIIAVALVLHGFAGAEVDESPA